MVYYLIALAVFLIDQISKWLIVSYMDIGEEIRVIGKNFFKITSLRNNGAAFSMLQGQRWFFLAITVIVLAGVVWFLQKNKERRWFSVALSLILGGALGNFLDRALYGEVVDFLSFHFTAFNYTFATFNLADSAIVCGVIMLLIDIFFFQKKENPELTS